MLYVVLHDGTVDELPAVTATDAKDGVLTCYDEQGRVVKYYERREVIAFSHDQEVKRIAENIQRGQ